MIDKIIIENGYTIQGPGEGYYEVNGLGDWTLAGDERTASILTDLTEINDIIADNILTDVKTIEVTRATFFFLKPPNDKQLELLRKLINDKP